MNFTSRISLGHTLAQKLERFHGAGAVILCLQESSLLTCLVMAKELRAWVFPLVYATVTMPAGVHQVLGAITQDGEFCAEPDSPAAQAHVPADVARAIKSQRPAALKSIRAQIKSYDLTLNKHVLDGRDVILAADVVTTAVPLIVANQFLRGVSPKSLTVAVGNAAPQAAQYLRLSAMQADILDILSGVVFDENHYFELADTYSPHDKRLITKHIAAFWH